MPQDQDLGVFGHGVHLVDADSLEHATHQTVEERKPHGERACPCSSSLVKAAVVLLDPSPCSSCVCYGQAPQGLILEIAQLTDS